MHRARRDLVLQTPMRTGQTTGSFALRSPVRPNPIASSIVHLVAIEGATLQVRGLDCLDGKLLTDLKPERGVSEEPGTGHDGWQPPIDPGDNDHAA